MSPPVRRALIFIAALATVALTVRLGFWQLSRADEKQALQALVDSRAAAAPVTLAAAQSQADGPQLLHRRVKLQGRWLSNSTVYLENRSMNARAGFYVVTLLKPDSADHAVLVIRGWAPRDFRDRTVLPPVATPDGEVQVQGEFVPFPSRLYEFGPSEKGPIRQNLDPEAYAAEVGQPLLGLAVRQRGEASEGLLRDWPRSDFGVDKHLGYAFQWFALAGIVVILYFWFQIVRPYQAWRRQPHP